MKKLLLASALAIASYPGYAADAVPDWFAPPQCDKLDGSEYQDCVNQEWQKHQQEAPPPRVTVAPPYQGPPPIGWVYGNPNTVSCAPGTEGPYGICGSFVVNVPGAAGLNVRVTPNGPAIMALVNGTPIIPIKSEGKWTLIAPACDLTPTWAWSLNAGVPLNRCWVCF